MRKIFQSAFLGLVLSVSMAAILTPAASLAQEEKGIADFAGGEEPPAFDSPDKAVEEFKSALAADNLDALARLLGLDAAKLRAREDVMDTYRQIREGAARQVVVQDLGENKVVAIGDRLWPLPFPLVKGDDGKWAFDTDAGFEEIINRRVGENELQAIDTMRAYIDAQKEYASDDRDGDGVLEYAQKLISSEGQTDGLYWPLEQGDGASPVGEFIEQAALERAKAGDGYFGYRFRILTSQGPNVAGGQHDFILNDNMIAGFGLVAWPVKYAETGVKTFIISDQGVLYERDLGPNTEEIVPFIDRFDPDDKWTVVKE